MTDQTDGAGSTPAQQEAAKAVARGFREKVKKLVESTGDRSQLFEALRGYQQNMDVELLVDTLSLVLNHPDRLPLFHDVRSMIPPKHHLRYNSMVPPPPSNSMRVITLKRHGKEGFGFSVRGGKEYNCGMFVSSIRQGSLASNAQLKIGEQLISIDGYPVSELIHEEVLNMLRGARSLRLRLKAVCMLPYQNDGDDTIHWQLIGADGTPHTPRDKGEDEEEPEAPMLGTLGLGERRVTITKDGRPLDCGITGGSKTSKKGIFVAGVVENGLAYQSGLQNNDQIMSVNGVSLKDVKHAEAIRVLKASNVLVMTVRSEKDAEQQEQWEKQMEEMHEKRMTEFAQARPSEDTKEAFYISPQLKDNPLMAQTTNMDLYGKSPPDDNDLGDIDVYSTNELLSDDDDDDDDDEKEEDGKGTAQKSTSPNTEGITSADDLAVSSTVQSHLQRLYIDQQRERHNRIHKSSEQRQQLLSEVRSLRKISGDQPAQPATDANDGSSKGTTADANPTKAPKKGTKQPKIPEEAPSQTKPSPATVTAKEDTPAVSVSGSSAQAAADPNDSLPPQGQKGGKISEKLTQEAASVKLKQESASGSLRSAKSEALYDEVKIVSFPATYAQENPATLHTGAVSRAGDVSIAKPTTEPIQDITVAPAVPAAFADDPPALPERNTARIGNHPPAVDVKSQSASVSATNSAAAETHSSVGVDASKNDTSTVTLQSEQNNMETAAVVEGSKTDIKYTQVSFKSRKLSTSDKPSANAEEPASVLSKGVPADSKPIPSPKPQLKAKPASSPKPQLKEKPVPSPKPTKKVMMGDASSSSADPLVEASQDAAPDTAKHSPPPPGADLPKASALKGSQSNDPDGGKKNKKKMKKQASFAAAVECVVIKPPANKHSSIIAEDLDDINPSNLEFGEDVLQGRRAEFHSIPKNGPLGIKLRGGIGTSTGGQIFIAGINPDGSVGQYGGLEVGDQILMVDGTNFVEISQREASQALHEAMQWETDCIDIVVATGGDDDEGSSII